MVGFKFKSCGKLKMTGFKFKSSGFIFVFILHFLVMIAAAKVTDPSEISALLAVKGSLVDPMNHLSNWNKGDPCTSNWTGVLCVHKNRVDKYWHVQEIQLLNMNLSGSLVPELGQFSHLTILDFMWNNLTGSIPKEIGNLSSLVLLLLNGNKLTGSLPVELGYLVNLDRFQIDQNHISGQIPKSFANLNNIKHIHFNNNSLSGQIPAELSNLSTLMHLLLDNNNLSGYLPSEFGKFPGMRILQLDNNHFEGEIPSSYGNLSGIVKISLRNCSLQGVIPDLSRLSDLSYLDLSRNRLTGSIPSYKLSNSMTTIDLSDNQLSGSIPESLSDLPSLQKLSLENNLLNGSISAELWQNKSFSATARLLLDFRNNSLSNINGALNPPVNASLRLNGNPICQNSNIQNKDKFCGTTDYGDYTRDNSKNSTVCPVQSCPTSNYFEYAPGSPTPCFCASPLRIGYRLKSPSFSYFRPYQDEFEIYITKSLGLDPYQLSIDSVMWEKGPRLRMFLKLFPKSGSELSSTFSTSDVLRIRGIFTTWVFPGSHFFGPYELLNFTLLGPYAHLNVGTPRKGIRKGVLVTVVIVAVVCALLISSILTVVIKKRNERYKHTSSRKALLSKLSVNLDGVKSFTFREMAIATENFSKSSVIGRGGYGKVYKGKLSDNKMVAIKRAEEGSLQGEKEFLTEIEILSRVHHRNLVSLVGYCDEEKEQMLVYEFIPRGTLRDWLNAKSGESLSFRMRLNVALDSAKAILYLHTEADPPIFHRDIKSSNILLDAKLTAKVADFGLSRLAPILDDNGAGPKYVSTLVRGTPGYLDPEYLLTHKLTDKSDVYSLGIVLLEILTSMKPISHGKNIVREVKIAHQMGTMFSIVDSRMGSYPSECIEKFVSLALWCCNDKPEKRPSMSDVVRELEHILEKMPETGDDFSEPDSKSFAESSSTSSFYSSSNVPGSDLSSGGNPVVHPR
uniref:probable LRR receptor-like serine/threonine-protein kinase At1g06840 n=1 Tax=Erigeron canadensis TaxID=72917 RepID=UPI001CB95566|nr:probable LRR receptor-like serine/threonine-protein kinase At1g06840 [Erigeron canadensis]